MDSLRESIRDRKVVDRQSSRMSLLNRNRGLQVNEESEVVSKEELIKKASALKVKSNVSCQLLSELMTAFCQNMENCSTFMQVSGALQALVTAVSGRNAGFQLNAVYCLCNLALSSEKSSCQIIKAAGPYLNVHLGGMNPYLIEACAWTIGNLSSFGEKCVKMLNVQGTMKHLTRLLGHCDNSVKTTSLYALALYVYHGFDILESHDLEEAVGPALAMYPESAFLLSLLSSSPAAQQTMIQRGLHVAFLDDVASVSIFQIRIVANLISEESGAAALQVIQAVDLSNILRHALTSWKPCLKKEVVWFLGNLAHHPNPQVQAAFASTNIMSLLLGQTFVL